LYRLEARVFCHNDYNILLCEGQSITMRVCSSIPVGRSVGRSVGWKIQIIENNNSSYTFQGIRKYRVIVKSLILSTYTKSYAIIVILCPKYKQWFIVDSRNVIKLSSPTDIM